MRQARSTAALLLLFASLAAQFSCHRARSEARNKRVIVLGIDAMDPKFLESHWDALPNLDRLRRQGEFKRLGTTIPPQSPVAWSTFATGLDPGGHGIYDFIHRDPKTMMPFSSMAEIEPPRHTLTLGPYVIPLSAGKVKSFRKGKVFWQLLAGNGVPVTILRMPNNFPPVECEGRQLSGMGTPDMRGTFGTFTFYTDDPVAKTRPVPGGQIVRVNLVNQHVDLNIEGPDNTLRKDQLPTSVTLSVDRDPVQPVARFSTGDTEIVLKQGEWSSWISVEFPMIPGIASATGMFRIYARKLQPDFQVYVSPVNIDPEDPELPISRPDSYSRDLAEAVGRFSTQGIGEDTAALREGVFNRREYLEQSRMVSEEHLRILQHAVDRFRSGLLFFHFFGVDQDSHMLWGKYSDELLETYKMVDRAIGRVMEKAGDSTLIVMSDHGFASFDRAVHLNTWLWREGFLTLDDPANAGDEELFPHVDWSQTEAYSLGLNGLYLNQVGRERYGIVEPGGESNEVLRTITERLLDFRDPKNGNKVVEKVYAARSVYHGDALESAPDLIVGWAPGYRSSWQTALGAVPKTVIEDNREEWRGDHCMAAESVPGVLLSNRRCRLGGPRLEDLTVTLLAEFGVPPAKGMSGRPVF